MSGSTKVKAISTYFVLSIESPSVHFSNTASESAYHSDKKRLFTKQLAVIKPALIALFDKLNTNAENDLKLREYNGKLPIIYEGETKISKRANRACRYSMFLSQVASMTGVAHIEIAFDELPDAKVIRNLKCLITKTINMAFCNKRKNDDEQLW